MTTIFTAYIKPKSWEKEGEIYEKLGIKLFFKITPFEIRRALTCKKPKPLKNKKDLKRYYQQTILAELAHLFSFLFMFAGSLYFVFTGDIYISAFIIMVNIMINLYPIFLMRYNRLRLRRIISDFIK